MSLNYLPKSTSKYVLDQGPSSDLCAESLDQRGAARNTHIICDRGAVERRQMTAIDDLLNKNKTTILLNFRCLSRIFTYSNLERHLQKLRE
jgi:hypothetical protein